MMPLQVVGIVVVLAASMATGYLIGIYRRSPAPRSVIFRAWINTSLNAVIVGGYFLAVTIAGPALAPVRPIVSALTIVGLIVLLSPPIYYALVVWRLRRRRPPEGTGTD